MIQKIVSGGQTGVDRAALDAALARGFPCGGWCPRGRKAEDGPLPAFYPLKESSSSAYPVRTEKNVMDSDGTVIITRGTPVGGTALTIRLAGEHKRPCLVINASSSRSDAAGQIREWADKNAVKVMNVAGPKESSCAGIYRYANSVILELLQGILTSDRRSEQ